MRAVLVHVDPGPDGILFPHPEVDQPRPPMRVTPEWSELMPELDRQPSDVVVTKHQPNAFYGTDLDIQLHGRGIRTILLGGISANVGVEATARAAHERGSNRSLWRMSWLRVKPISILIRYSAFSQHSAADHAWCVATKVDYGWTYIGALRSCIRAILSDSRFEAVETSATASW